MGVLENGLIYALEMGKFYLVFKYFLGIEFKNEKWRYGCALLLLMGFAVFLEYYEGNPIFGYLVFIMAEMYLLFREKMGRMVVISLWLASVIGVLDEIATIFIKTFSEIGEEREFCIDFTSSWITILFAFFLIFLIKKISGRDEIRINLIYYLFFSALGLADAILLGGIRMAYESMGEDNFLKLPLLATAVCMYIQMEMVLTLAVSRDEYKKKDMLNKEYLKIQEEQYDYLQKKETDIRTFRHDMNDHILVLRELCEEEQYDKLKDYVKQITNQMHIDDNRAATGNRIVDAVINQYLFMAEQEGVALKIKGKFLGDEIESYDWCVIFSNLLRNAVEAARDSEKKRAELLIKDTEKELLIRIWNDYKGERKTENGRYITTKKDKESHGIGLSNVQKSIQKYQGVMRTVAEDEKFTVMIEIRKKK